MVAAIGVRADHTTENLRCFARRCGDRPRGRQNSGRLRYGRPESAGHPRCRDDAARLITRHPRRPAPVSSATPAAGRSRTGGDVVWLVCCPSTSLRPRNQDRPNERIYRPRRESISNPASHSHRWKPRQEWGVLACSSNAARRRDLRQWAAFQPSCTLGPLKQLFSPASRLCRRPNTVKIGCVYGILGLQI